MVSSILNAFALLSLGASVLAAPSTVKREPNVGVVGVNQFSGAIPVNQFGGVHGVNNFGAVGFNNFAAGQVHGGNAFAFNNFGGLASLHNFDDFFGVNNFAGVFNVQNQVLQNQVIQNQLVCQQLEVNLLQQRLAVVREFAKKVLLQQACDVELQVLALQQFVSGFDAFGQDLRRSSGRNLFFDQGIAHQIGGLFDPTTFALTNHNLGFLGNQIGSNAAFVNGFNWVDATSPFSVGNVFDQSNLAIAAALNLSSSQHVF